MGGVPHRDPSRGGRRRRRGHLGRVRVRPHGPHPPPPRALRGRPPGHGRRAGGRRRARARHRDPGRLGVRHGAPPLAADRGPAHRRRRRAGAHRSHDRRPGAARARPHARAGSAPPGHRSRTTAPSRCGCRSTRSSPPATRRRSGGWPTGRARALRPIALDPELVGSYWRAGATGFSLTRTASGAPLLTARALAPAPSARRALLERDALEDVGDPLAGVD